MLLLLPATATSRCASSHYCASHPVLAGLVASPFLPPPPRHADTALTRLPASLLAVTSLTLTNILFSIDSNSPPRKSLAIVSSPNVKAAPKHTTTAAYAAP